MSEELSKELSRLQLLWSRYKNKLSMCPLEIKKEEIRAYIIYEHIKNLRHQLKQRDEVIDEAIEYIEKNMNQKLYTGEQIFDTYSPASDLLEILKKYKGDSK